MFACGDISTISGFRSESQRLPNASNQHFTEFMVFFGEISPERPVVTKCRPPHLLPLGAAFAAAFVALNTATALIDLLVIRGAISRDDAHSVLTTIAEQTRDDAGGSSADEAADAFVHFLGQQAERYRCSKP